MTKTKGLVFPLPGPQNLTLTLDPHSYPKLGLFDLVNPLAPAQGSARTFWSSELGSTFCEQTRRGWYPRWKANVGRVLPAPKALEAANCKHSPSRSRVRRKQGFVEGSSSGGTNWRLNYPDNCLIPRLHSTNVERASLGTILL